jgi:hypothetical protein
MDNPKYQPSVSRLALSLAISAVIDQWCEAPNPTKRTIDKQASVVLVLYDLAYLLDLNTEDLYEAFGLKLCRQLEKSHSSFEGQLVEPEF